MNYCCLPLKRVAGSILSGIGGDLVLLTFPNGVIFWVFLLPNLGVYKFGLLGQNGVDLLNFEFNVLNM